MDAVESALYTRLAATAGVTSLLATATSIYNLRPPGSAVFPMVIYGLQSGIDDNDNPHRTRQLLYLVKAIVADSAPGGSKTMPTAGAIDAACDTALHKVVLTVTGWSNIWLVRESDVRYIEDAAGGHRFYHAGGIYRVRLAS